MSGIKDGGRIANEGSVSRGDDGFRDAWDVVKVEASEFDVWFRCPCGHPDLMSASDDPTCPACGRVYRLDVAFEVREP